MIRSLYVVNKSGGLIYHREFRGPGRLDTNDTLRVASIWHSLHAISSQLSPVPGCRGIELLEADTFDLHCYQTPTGTKFFSVVSPGAQGVPADSSRPLSRRPAEPRDPAELYTPRTG